MYFLPLAEDCDGFAFSTPARWAEASGAIPSLLDRAIYTYLGGRRQKTLSQ